MIFLAFIPEAISLLVNSHRGGTMPECTWDGGDSLRLRQPGIAFPPHASGPFNRPTTFAFACDESGVTNKNAYRSVLVFMTACGHLVIRYDFLTASILKSRHVGLYTFTKRNLVSAEWTKPASVQR